MGTARNDWRERLRAECLGENLKAENGIRTRDPQLGKLMLYQLSYFRVLCDRWSGRQTGFHRP